MKVMVVDDAPANRMVLTALLKSAGYAVVAADSSVAAVEMFAAECPDVVLTDLHLENGASGVELARSLKRLSEATPPRIAIVTGDPDPSISSDPAIDAVLAKPASLANLTAFINQEAQ